jgi:hypothetical protein
MMLRTEPPGATVYVDGYEIGATPIATDFIYYGTRQIRLVKDGYETLTIMQPTPTPWYEIMPLDFVSENVSPVPIRDYHSFTYRLTPQIMVPTASLRDRAEQLRRDSALRAPLVAPGPVALVPPCGGPDSVPVTAAPPPGGPPLIIAPPGDASGIGGQPVHAQPPGPMR